MANLFELVRMTKCHINFFLVPIFYVLIHYLNKKQLKIYRYYTNYIDECTHEYSGEKAEECLKLHKFAFFFNIFFPKILSIFPYLVFRKKKNNNLASAQAIRIRNTNINVNNNTKKAIMIILVIIISVLEIFYRTESYSKYEKAKNYLDIKLGNIFLIPIFSFFIINGKISRHHIFSFILSFFGIFLICFFLNSNYQNRDYYESEIRSFSDQMKHLSFSIYSSLALVLSKILFDDFILIFLYIFYEGILIFILITIFAILGIGHFGDYLENISSLIGSIRLLFLFLNIDYLSFGYYLSNSLIIYYFSPNHLIISEILSLFLRWIIEILFENKIENEDKAIIFIKIVSFLIIFISSLVYNEILILHFFGCDNVQNIMENDELIENNNIDSQNIIKDGNEYNQI